MPNDKSQYPSWFNEKRAIKEAAAYCKDTFVAVGKIWILHHDTFMNEHPYIRMIWCLRVSECKNTGFRFFEEKVMAEAWRVLHNIEPPTTKARLTGKKANMFIMDELSDGTFRTA